MKRLLLAAALGGTVLGLSGCNLFSHPAPKDDATTEAAMAPSDEPSAPGTGDASDDGQGGPINRPPTVK